MRARFGGWKDWLWLIVSALLFLSALILPISAAFALTEEETQLQSAYESGTLIRLHILADSDDPRDQALKLAVRDTILDAFGALLTEAAGDGSLYETLLQNVPAMQAVAESRVQELGCDESVQAEAGILFLPKKTYGRVTLPAGKYRALRITLGSGQGRNWWCVLYPRLCLALSENEPTDEPGFTWQTPRIFHEWMLFGH